METKSGRKDKEQTLPVKQFRQGYVFISIVAMSIGIHFLNCAFISTIGSNDKKNNQILSYKFSESEWVQYTARYDETLTIEGNGNYMEVGTIVNADFSIRSSTLSNNDLSIRIDTLRSENSGILQNHNTDYKNLIGKPFHMTMSPSGAVSGFTGVDSLQFNPGFQGGIRANAEHFFKYWGGNLFPGLPSQPFKEGEIVSLEYTDTVSVPPIHIIKKMRSSHTLLGKQVVQERECYKVSIRLNGTLETAPGDVVTAEGDIESEGVYYFDIKNGLIIQCEMSFLTELTTIQPSGDAIPSVLENRVTYKLVTEN